MQSWLGKRLIDFQLAALRRGDPWPSLSLAGHDVELTFPGTHSWSGVYRGKVALGRASGEGQQCVASCVSTVVS